MTKDEAITALKEALKPYRNKKRAVYNVLHHVSASGMTRAIGTFVVIENEIHRLDYYMVKAGIGKFNNKHGGITVTGCGMDMGFHLVDNMMHVALGLGSSEWQKKYKQEWLR